MIRRGLGRMLGGEIEKVVLAIEAPGLKGYGLWGGGIG